MSALTHANLQFISVVCKDYSVYLCTYTVLIAAVRKSAVGRKEHQRVRSVLDDVSQVIIALPVNKKHKTTATYILTRTSFMSPAICAHYDLANIVNFAPYSRLEKKNNPKHHSQVYQFCPPIQFIFSSYICVRNKFQIKQFRNDCSFQL